MIAIKGVKGSKRAIGRAKAGMINFRDAAGMAIYEESEKILQIAKDLAPVGVYLDGQKRKWNDPIPLRERGMLTRVWANSFAGKYVEKVIIWFWAAVDQHESNDYEHPNGGESGFLRKAFQRRMPGLVSRVNRRIGHFMRSNRS